MDFGYTTDNNDDVLLYEELSKISKEIIIVADHSKFDKVSFKKISDLNQFKRLISNKTIPDKYKNYFFTNNIKIYTTYEIKQ